MSVNMRYFVASLVTAFVGGAAIGIGVTLMSVGS